MAEKLIGTDIAPPDLVAKITGRARYSEDFRPDGMVFAKLLLSPMPHGRVRSVDASRALAMEGVIDILRAEEVPQLEGPREACLTDEPHYEGEPVLAVAAVTEEIAAAAIEAIDVDFEPLPFVLDPLDSLRPGGPTAYSEGNRFALLPDAEPGDPAAWTDFKWTDADFAEIHAGRMPNAESLVEWSKGDVDAAFAGADLIVEDLIVHQSVTHHPMEPRTNMAYWENGKLYAHVSTQSTQRTKGAIAGALGIDPEDVVLIAEYCGGGFGSKIAGTTVMQIPAIFSRKINRPVMPAHHALRRELCRARPPWIPELGQDGLSQRREVHGRRSLHRRGGRRVWLRGQWDGRRDRRPDIHSSEHALSRRGDADEHSAQVRTAGSGWCADRRHARTDLGEGGSGARYRSAPDAPDQCAGCGRGVRSARYHAH